MRWHPIFSEIFNCSHEEEVFSLFMATLKESITTWEYFVNWAKATTNLRDIEINLHLLDYLVGKENIEDEARDLFRKYPDLSSIVPILIASREDMFSILSSASEELIGYERYDFRRVTDAPPAPERAVEFLIKSGFLEQLRTKRIRSLVDFVFGVEVGLDSNGRKNRGGQAMEKIVESFVRGICTRNDFRYEKQVSAPRIKDLWGLDVPTDKSTRRMDFAVRATKQLVLIETSFYSGGGSKLKATAGEYKELHKRISRDHKFVWITDGAGWRTTHRPLAETFYAVDHILNLEMVQRGVLEAIMLE